MKTYAHLERCTHALKQAVFFLPRSSVQIPVGFTVRDVMTHGVNG